ncbi:reticulon-like protein B5 [Telopea speciosissima]|uniref:reticulon-like protein B5 n=1 Tax=Telopea speciosissima TaxID=54955 RepID=UPI001CC51E55|nr:reticulon-like protein B5 [Telopea speciosissima]XP_043703684.1 reticulon-like protein B5 [Telopea speciosissima]
MSDPVEDAGSESLMDNITQKIHKHDDSSSSSSDSESEKYLPTRKNCLFGRQKPVHAVLGGGKSADIILWRNKQKSACIVAGVTVIWLLFERMDYHLLTFVCHSLILALATSFIWSNFSPSVNKPPPKLPEVIIPEDIFVSIALSLRHECNQAFATLREVASGQDLKKFLMVIALLWILSVVGSWFNFLTLFYIVFVLLHAVPVLYEKHEDQVDTFAEKAVVEIYKQYAVLDAKVLQKLPKCPFNSNNNKQH